MMLLNASNLHVGGGVQVATSVIGELSRMSDIPPKLHIWASSAVHANLEKLGYNLEAFPHYKVIDISGIRLLLSPRQHFLNRFDAVFTIFGPLYVFWLGGKNICGFASPWIIYPSNEVYSSLSFTKRFWYRCINRLKCFFFKRADQLVVELDHVRTGLIKCGIMNDTSIHVVPNSISSIYGEPEKWQHLVVPDTKAKIKLGFVGRNYLHKNTHIFPEIIEFLQQKYDIEVSIYVTFSVEEWGACSPRFRYSVINVGPLLVAQCPSFYKQMDAVLFPSLLECFSATPLEAMAMEKPLFVSDRPFNRDICQEYAHYFDPFSPESAADKIADVFLSSKVGRGQLEVARRYAVNFSSPRLRALKYLDILQNLAQSSNSDKDIV